MATHEESKSASMTAPHGSSTNPDPTRAPKYLTGTSETFLDEQLANGEMYTLMVGETAVRVGWTGFNGDSPMESTSLLFLPGARFDWFAEANKTDQIYMAPGDGTSSFEAWVWRSSR